MTNDEPAVMPGAEAWSHSAPGSDARGFLALHAVLLRNLLTQGRQLDNKNPRAEALGSDFGRLGIELISNLKAAGQAVADAVDSIEVLVDFRNAVAHGNESELAAVIGTGRSRRT